MKRKELLVVVASVCLVLILAPLASGCARGPAVVPPAEFFKTKTLDWTAAGGGNIDLAARIMLPAMAKHLGTTGTVTVRAGGGGFEGHNWVWNAEPDGTHFDFWNMYALVGDVLFNPQGMQFELDKFSYVVGFPSVDRFIFYVAVDSPYTSIEALKAAKNLKLGGPAPASLYTLGTVAVASLLDLDAKVLTGLQGGSGIALSIAQKEIAGGVMAATQGPLFKDRIKPLFVLGTRRTTLFPAVPALGELVTFSDPTKKALHATGDSLFGDLRAVFTGPNVPKERLQYLNEVFVTKVIPEVRPDLEKAFGGVVYKPEEFMPGQEVTKLIAGQMEKTNELRQLFKGIIEKYRM